MNPKKLARKVLPKRAVKLAEESYRKSRLGAAHLRYGLPARGLKVIAVTGTNGKTTTCFFINEMLKSAGYNTAMFTTAVIETKGVAKPNTTTRTVVLTADLFKLLKQAKRENVDYVVLEVTSQALHQHKLWGIPIEAAVMTNLSQEHLDYHKTMESYAAAKARLFNRYMRPKFCVLNRDDEWYEYFAKESVGRVVSYGRNIDSTLKLITVDSSAQGSHVQAAYSGNVIEFATDLVGEFNAYNAAAAVATGLAIGLGPAQASAGVGALKAVPGRMEPVDAGQPFGVIIDYAVTPDALANALRALRPATSGKLSIVFGATGDRDKTKRPIMGEVAAQLADKIYLTDDETYTEDPDAIRREVYIGIARSRAESKTEVIPERKDAIEAAIKSAKAGDTILITGIGHQTTRNMAGHKLPWSEHQIVQKLLDSY